MIKKHAKNFTFLLLTIFTAAPRISADPNIIAFCEARFLGINQGGAKTHELKNFFSMRDLHYRTIYFLEFAPKKKQVERAGDHTLVAVVPYPDKELRSNIKREDLPPSSTPRTLQYLHRHYGIPEVEEQPIWRWIFEKALKLHGYDPELPFDELIRVLYTDEQLIVSVTLSEENGLADYVRPIASDLVNLLRFFNHATASHFSAPQIRKMAAIKSKDTPYFNYMLKAYLDDFQKTLTPLEYFIFRAMIASSPSQRSQLLPTFAELGLVSQSELDAIMQRIIHQLLEIIDEDPFQRAADFKPEIRNASRSLIPQPLSDDQPISRAAVKGDQDDDVGVPTVMNIPLHLLDVMESLTAKKELTFQATEIGGETYNHVVSQSIATLKLPRHIQFELETQGIEEISQLMAIREVHLKNWLGNQAAFLVIDALLRQGLWLRY